MTRYGREREREELKYRRKGGIKVGKRAKINGTKGLEKGETRTYGRRRVGAWVGG